MASPSAESPVFIQDLQAKVDSLAKRMDTTQRILDDVAVDVAAFALGPVQHPPQEEPGDVRPGSFDELVSRLDGFQTVTDRALGVFEDQLRELRASLEDTDALVDAFPVALVHTLGERVARIEELLENRPVETFYPRPVLSHRGPG